MSLSMQEKKLVNLFCDGFCGIMHEISKTQSYAYISLQLAIYDLFLETHIDMIVESPHLDCIIDGRDYLLRCLTRLRILQAKREKGIMCRINPCVGNKMSLCC
jgi:hypothetical protein